MLQKEYTGCGIINRMRLKRYISQIKNRISTIFWEKFTLINQKQTALAVFAYPFCFSYHIAMFP